MVGGPIRYAILIGFGARMSTSPSGRITRVHIDLSRFERHHPDTVRAALSEIRAGQRTAAWVPCLLPRIGDDECGIHSIEEAEAYLLEGVLFRDYGAIVEAIRERLIGEWSPVSDVLGPPADQEFIASLTLVRGISERLTGNGFAQMVDTCNELLDLVAEQGYEPCPLTLAFLANSDHP